MATATTRAIDPSHNNHFANPAISHSGRSKPTAVDKDLGATPLSLASNTNPRLSRSPPEPSVTSSHASQLNQIADLAAMASERQNNNQKSKDNPQQMSPKSATSAINSLLGNDASQNKSKDAQAATQMSEPLAKVAKSIQIPDNVTTDALQTSPVSLSSFGSLESSATAATATAIEPVTTGPYSGVTATAGPDVQPQNSDASAPLESLSNRALTFPGVPQDPTARPPQRGMSLPMSGYNNQNNTKSSPAKRHKCPYCSTDFTRHHNLKSHLLTHSQEKPYECTTCQARFRRLHDLKRHTKLHTGERPHICPKCGRKFARGDALARHNKGQGGCAGRRSSIGVDDDGDRVDDTMDGLEYQDHGDEKMDEDEGNLDGAHRATDPTSRHTARQNSTQSNPYQHGSTYPPVGHIAGNSARSLYPPNNPASATRDHPSALSPNAGSSMSSLHYNPNGGVFTGMTESPKPISPGHADSQHRMAHADGSLPGGRSPSISQHNPPYGRSATGPTSPRTLPPPNQLPSLPGLAPTDPRLLGGGHTAKSGSISGPANAPNMLPQANPGQHNLSNPGSLSSHGQSSGGSMREILGGRETDLWQYIRDLEARTQRSTEEYESRIARLENELNSLKSQLQQAQQASHHPQGR